MERGRSIFLQDTNYEKPAEVERTLWTVVRAGDRWIEVCRGKWKKNKKKSLTDVRTDLERLEEMSMKNGASERQPMNVRLMVSEWQKDLRCLSR